MIVSVTYAHKKETPGSVQYVETTLSPSQPELVGSQYIKRHTRARIFGNSAAESTAPIAAIFGTPEDIQAVLVLAEAQGLLSQ